MNNKQQMQHLISTLSDEQIQLISEFAIRVSTIKAERWTGKLVFELNANQGGIGSIHVNKGEILRIKA